MDAAAETLGRRDRQRKPLVRLVIRRAHAKGEIDAKQMRQVLDDDDMFAAVVAKAESFAADDDDPTTFLEKLLAALPQIIAFIKELIAMFTV